MPYPLTITIDQTGDGRFRASYSDPARVQSDLEPGFSAPIVTPRQAEATRSIEADNFAVLTDQLKGVLGSALIRDGADVETAADADEDAKDLADARAALEDVRKNGGSPWEQVEAEMGFLTVMASVPNRP